jgi:hypothetical protein
MKAQPLRPTPRARAQFGPPPKEDVPVVVENVNVAQTSAKGSAKATMKVGRKEKVKADPKLIAAARELRDQYLERVNTSEQAPRPRGKYDVSRAIVAPERPLPLLKAG